MIPELLLIATPVTLDAMLEAREERLKMQHVLMERYHETLVSFTLNMVGEKKVFPLAIETYENAVAQIGYRLKTFGVPILAQEEIRAHTGYESFFVVQGDPLHVKKILTSLEESHPLGRLFDIDVLDITGKKQSREEIGYPPRQCFLCEEQAFLCSRSRRHSVAELHHFATTQMWNYFAKEYSHSLGQLVTNSLLYEVSVTPKPGLVDQNNNGSHPDMNLRLFEQSAFALADSWATFVETGITFPWKQNQSEEEVLQALFARLRPLGQEAECAMYHGTGGVNTHKGAIFSLGIFLGAMGYLYGKGEAYSRDRLSKVIEKMCVSLGDDFAHLSEKNSLTHGEKLYLEHGVKGVRGEAVDGYPSLFHCALPLWEKGLAQGLDTNGNGVHTLLHLMAQVEDSTLIHRLGYVLALEKQEELKHFLATPMDFSAFMSHAKEMDRDWNAHGLSAGGCADLLALTYFIVMYEEDWGEYRGF